MTVTGVVSQDYFTADHKHNLPLLMKHKHQNNSFHSHDFVQIGPHAAPCQLFNGSYNKILLRNANEKKNCRIYFSQVK